MMFGKAKRFDDKLNNENMKGIWHLAGPGSYDLNKDNWNKKTFNVLFSGTQQKIYFFIIFRYKI